MNDLRPTHRDPEPLAWGIFFIWWGITEMFPALPRGTGALGLGLILLGLNGARALGGLPTSGFTLTLGVLALLLGGLELVATLLALSYELPIFAILLIVCGVLVLARSQPRLALR